jgi:DNA-binding NarL/FixJ family response regulator
LNRAADFIRPAALVESRAVKDTIRVVLLEMPQMLRDILKTTIGRQPDIELIDEAPDDAETQRAIPHVVLVSTESPSDADGTSTLLSRWPRARIIAIEVSGRQASLYELRPCKMELGQLSPTELLEGIRAAARRGPSTEGLPIAFCRDRSH